MFRVTADQSIEKENGQVVFFSFQRFVKEIVHGDRCFICGADPQFVTFNDEHILPDWLLRKYDLHNRAIYLPNGTTFRYDQFKIPCCRECNKSMGEVFEEPISTLFDKGPQALNDHVKNEGPWRLFCWMCLIFLKTHLKDTNLRFHKDQRKGEDKIGDRHSWDELHHIHCVARSFHTHCNLKKEVLGSLVVLPAKVSPHLESFDYCDLSVAQTMLLRLDRSAIIVILDDSQASLTVALPELQSIQGPLSPLQLREIAARMATVNIHLRDRPRFGSEFDTQKEEYSIYAVRPEEVCVEPWNRNLFGKIMHQICAPLLKGLDDTEGTVENLKTGRYTFLKNERGEFMADHMDLVQSEVQDES